MIAAPEGVELVANGGWDERVLVLRRGALVDVFAVVTERWVVLIDTLDTPAAAEAALAHLRAPLAAGRQLLVVNTHADWDHAWGNAAFAGPGAAWPTPIVGHRLCRERLRSPAARDELARKQAAEPDRFGAVRLVPPTIAFDDGLTIDGGDLTLELLPTPGHQPDHIAVWLPELRLLLPGDAAEEPFPSVADAAGLPASRASLARLAALDPATVLACHAPGRADPGLLAANIAYFDALEARCRAAVARGRAPHPPADADVGPLIGFELDAAAPGGLPADQEDYYHASHDGAIRAMLAWLSRG